MTTKADCPYCGDEECPVGLGWCHCGCGQQTDPVNSPTYMYYGTHIPRGTPKKWRAGHWMRGREAFEELPDIVKIRKKRLEAGNCPYCGELCDYGVGLCHCGCGEETNVLERSYYPRGDFKGLPTKYVKSHNQRRLTVPEVRELRYRYATDDDLTQADLAREYGVTKSTITRTLLGDIWKDAGIATSEEVEG